MNSWEGIVLLAWSCVVIKVHGRKFFAQWHKFHRKWKQKYPSSINIGFVLRFYRIRSALFVFGLLGRARDPRICGTPPCRRRRLLPHHTQRLAAYDVALRGNGVCVWEDAGADWCEGYLSQLGLRRY